MNNDRQHFEKVVLDNGIELYFHKMDTPFFEIRIVLPVGSVHSHTGNIGGVGGIAHFVEHMSCLRSEKYPEKHSFEHKISNYAGLLSGRTYPWYTEMYASAPSEHFLEILTGLVDHAYHPIFVEEDVEIERDIIRNERMQRRYYPGSSEIGQYLSTKWINNESYTKEQLFGSDEDLHDINAEEIKTFHQNYLSDKTKVLIGGAFDKETTIAAFSKIKTHNIHLKVKSEPVSWAHKDYHTYTSKDIEAPELVLGGFATDVSSEIRFTLFEMLKYLTNYETGILYQWLRKEKGWVYSIEQNISVERDRLLWDISFPLTDKDKAETIRKEIDGKIREALKDTEAINRFVTRRLAERVFLYQTLDNRLNTAEDSLDSDGRILTESDYVGFLKVCAGKDYFLNLYERFAAPQLRGEVLLLPKK